MKKVVLIIAFISAVLVNANAQQTNIRTAYNKTLKAYFDLKNGLATDDVNLAASASKDLLTTLKVFPSKSLNISQQPVWHQQAEEIKKSASAIAATKNLDLQRKSFEGVARAIIKLTKALQLNNNEVYVQFCPMAKKSWLNEVEDVQNPFYGSKMYDCGEVTDTVAKK
jgi:hypothetical protein